MPPPKPLPYPGDQYIVDLIAKEGYIKKDANGNVIIGNNVTIDTRSMENFITADNANVENSHNNTLLAKNIIIKNASGCTATGADHNIVGDTTGESASYCDIGGDANWSEGYAAFTRGEGNTNCCENGDITGTNNRIGIKMQDGGTPNHFSNSSIRGNNNVIEGSHSHITGDWIIIKGDNITVNGSGLPGQPQTFTIAGTYNLNPK